MALFNLVQTFGEDPPEEWKVPTFKECVKDDVDNIFFNIDEFAENHIVDGKEHPIVIEEEDVRRHSAHWEAGAKQNFDTGLYNAHTILYIKVSDYGPRPKVGKYLELDEGTDHKRTYKIIHCEEDVGVYRMTMERVRQ